MEILESMLTLALIYSTPIIITALGGLFSERSGIVNIGLEGLMMVGAFTGATITVLLEPVFPAYLASIVPWIGVIIGAIVGGLFSLLHAYLSIDLRADQVISGTAINMLAMGITIFLAQIIFQQQRTDAFRRGFIKMTVPYLSKIPIIGPIFFTNIYSTVFVAFVLVFITYYIVYKTPFGLRLRACGEHPSAADSMGINVRKMRYYGVVISGIFAGLGGAIMVMTQNTQYTAAAIHGIGFIALAALIFGKWKPIGVLGAGLFFGFSQILSTYTGDIPYLNNLPSQFFDSFPYILTVIALVIFSKNQIGPRAAGEVYEKGLR